MFSVIRKVEIEGEVAIKIKVVVKTDIPTESSVCINRSNYLNSGKTMGGNQETCYVSSIYMF